MCQTILLNWSKIEYVSRKSVIAWFWKSVTDRQTNSCIELRYTQLITDTASGTAPLRSQSFDFSLPALNIQIKHNGPVVIQ